LFLADGHSRGGAGNAPVTICLRAQQRGSKKNPPGTGGQRLRLRGLRRFESFFPHQPFQ